MSSAGIALPQGVSRIIINQIEDEAPAKMQGPAPIEADDKKGNRQLPEDLKKAFVSLLTHYGTTVDKMARRYEVVDARRQRFYDRGYQYIYFNWGSYVFLPITAGQVMSVGSESVQMPRYCGVYNIYKPYRRNLAAMLSQNPPGVNFKPKQPVSLDIKSAEEAQKYSEHYDQVNSLRKLQTKLARLFYTDGRIVAWTRHEKNAEKWGTFQEQEDEQIDREDQPASGVDAATQGEMAAQEDQDEANAEAERQKAIGEEITTLHGVLEAKCFPITAEDQDQLLGVILSDDPPIETAKERYSWISEEIKAGESGKGETALERNARLGILQGMKVWAQSQDSYAHLTERQHMFLRRAAYNHLAPELRDRMRKIFPKGCRVTFVSGVYAEAFNVSLDDELMVDHPLDGDGMNRPSWGKDHMQVQDAFNNYRNMRQEYHDYGIPATYYDLAIMDGQAQRERVSHPGEFIGIVNPSGVPGTQIENYFYTPPAIAPPADLIQAEQDLRDALSQLITGIQPALFGGNLAQGKEADRVGVYQMAREQAMGVMAMPWGTVQGIIARCKYQAVLAAARNRREDEVLNILPQKKGQRKPKPLTVSIADLSKGNFRAEPDTDSSYPATRAMKKGAFQEFMGAAEFNPMLAEAAQQPDNMELGAQLEGLPEIDIPAARAWARQLDEIDQLLATGPIPPSLEEMEAAIAKQTLMTAAAASAAGQPAPNLPPEMQMPAPEQLANPEFMKSGAWLDNPLMLSLAKCSLEPDPEDYHDYHIQSIKNWFNSSARDKEIEAGNKLGIANVRLHKDLHKKLAAAEAAEGQPNPAQLMMAAMAAKQKGAKPSQPAAGAQPQEGAAA